MPRRSWRRTLRAYILMLASASPGLRRLIIQAMGNWWRWPEDSSRRMIACIRSYIGERTDRSIPRHRRTQPHNGQLSQIIVALGAARPPPEHVPAALASAPSARQAALNFSPAPDARIRD